MTLELWQFFLALIVIIGSSVGIVYTIKGDVKALIGRVHELEKYKEANEPLKMQMNLTMQEILTTLKTIQKSVDIMDNKFEEYRKATDKEIKELIKNSHN